MQARRVAIPLVAGVLLAAALFVIPTVWLRPWSVDHFYLRVFVELLLEQPMLLSALRVIEPYGLRFHEDDVDDLSLAAARAQAERVRHNLELLRSYDREDQDPGQQLSSDVLDWFLDDLDRGRPFQFHDYPLNAFQGVQSQLPEFMLQIHPLEDALGARNYLARLQKLGPALDQVIAGVRYRAEQGVLPPRFVLLAVLDEVRAHAATPPREHALFTHLETKSGEIDDLAADARERLLAETEIALAEGLLPAYGRVAALIETLLPDADDDAGVWKLPDGDAYYAWALRHHTTSELSPEEVHALGLAEVERLTGEIRSLLEGEGIESTELGATLHDLHRDPRFLFPEDDAGREQVLAGYAEIVDATRPALPALFGRLPEAGVRVERVPAFREEGSARAYYFPPALDGTRPGVFYANLRSVAEHPSFGMRTLAYHEAIPGHHLQIAIAMELEGLPLFRRVIPFTAFVEGWALYAERLAAEQGLHPTAFDLLGQRVAELWRGVRLVVDTGLHAKRWTREQAIDYMESRTGMPTSDVVAEVERYIVNPGQACAYKLGQLTILRLRERAMQALGPRFDLRAFHDAVLGNGSLPLTLLEREIEAWIASQES